MNCCFLLCPVFADVSVITNTTNRYNNSALYANFGALENTRETLVRHLCSCTQITAEITKHTTNKIRICFL